jgi:hypothetical protein
VRHYEDRSDGGGRGDGERGTVADLHAAHAFVVTAIDLLAFAKSRNLPRHRSHFGMACEARDGNVRVQALGERSEMVDERHAEGARDDLALGREVDQNRGEVIDVLL